MYDVSLDAGSRKSGVAIFRDKLLIHAQLVKVSPKMLLHVRIHMMAVAIYSVVMKYTEPHQFVFTAEWPQVYGGPRREDPNDLFPVAGVICALRTLLGSSVSSESYPSPFDWKGNRKKEIIMPHIFKRLSAQERAMVKDPKNSDCVESVGVGLYALGRGP